jgi:hypothetical protein
LQSRDVIDNERYIKRHVSIFPHGRKKREQVIVGLSVCTNRSPIKVTHFILLDDSYSSPKEMILLGYVGEEMVAYIYITKETTDE